MVEILKQIEDRYLALVFVLAITLAYTATRDPLLGDMMKVAIGIAGGIFAKRSERNLIVAAGDAQTQAIVKEFWGRDG